MLQFFQVLGLFEYFVHYFILIILLESCGVFWEIFAAFVIKKFLSEKYLH